MKDAKGHGSNSRGSYPNIDMNLRGPGKHVGYAGGDVFHIRPSGAGGFVGVGQKNAGLVSGNTLRAISDKLIQYDQDAARARNNPAIAIAQQHDISTEHLK